MRFLELLDQEIRYLRGVGPKGALDAREAERQEAGRIFSI